MNRTRLVLVIVGMICLAIILASLAGGLAYSGTLLRIYIAGTIFAAGVVALDFLGILGGHHGDAIGHDFAVTGDHGLGGHDAGADGLGGHDAAAAGHDGGGAGDHAAAGEGHAADHAAEAAEHDGSHEAAQQTVATQHTAVTVQHTPAILSVLAYLRMFVYFCLGFCPVGWVAMSSGRTAGASLLYAVPAGIITVVVARAFFRFQRKDTGAVRPESELVGERATVIVPLDHAQMGKVRVQAGMNVTEVYALAEEHDCKFARGEEVRIVRVAGDCVHVR